VGEKKGLDFMAEGSIISWTKHTWNPWRGCQKISPGCKHCYMFAAQKRYGRDPSIVTRTQTWRDPLRWQKEAAARGEQWNVFTCSWSDWFIESADAWRDEAWRIIRACPNLTFQILTKRPGNIQDRLPADWGVGYQNVWLGVSIESAEYTWRRDELVRHPAVVHFISAEPLLEDIAPTLNLEHIEWLIVGGESGPGWRPMNTSWARSLRDKCRESGTVFFFKQSAAPRTEMGVELDGEILHAFPHVEVAA
jgi:protein gp37